MQDAPPATRLSPPPRPWGVGGDRWGLPRRRGAKAAALGGVAVVAALVVAGCSASPSTSTPASSPAHPRAAGRGVRGTISAENGSTWTVAARNGVQYTVTLSASTQYGTKADPATPAQFPVGAPVAVTGPVSGTTVAATRIAVPKAAPAPGGASATPAPAPAGQ